MKYKKGTFVVVPNIDQLDVLPATQQALFMWMCRYADEDGTCFPSRKRLAEHLLCSVRTVDKHLDEMINIGFLSKTIRRKKGSNQNMSNLYQIHLLHEEGAENDTTPSAENSTVTISNTNYTQLTKEVSSTKEDVFKEEKPYSFLIEFEKLGSSSWVPDKIIYNYWLRKGFTFDNLKQFKSNRSRNIRPAISLEGYTSRQIDQAMDYCEEKYKDVGWTLETVGKRIAEIVNKI